MELPWTRDTGSFGLQARAGELTDPNAKKQTLMIAVGYETLAADAAAVARSTCRSSSPGLTGETEATGLCDGAGLG